MSNGSARPAPESGSARISIAMATYNGARFIRKQLDSIGRQTLLPYELVITDDGSTDATLEIVDDFAQIMPFEVRVYQNQMRLGYFGNFLKAASLCRGEIVAFCDQDDIWLEEKLNLCVQFFSDPEIVLTAHSAWTLLDSGSRGYRFPNFRRTSTRKCCGNVWFQAPPGFTMMVRRQIVDIGLGTGRPPHFFSHDQWLWFVAGSVGKTVTIADALTLYRQHQANQFGAESTPTLFQRIRRSTSILNFDKVADSEAACSRFLQSAAKLHPEVAETLERSARYLQIRSRLHRMRANLYRRDATILIRIVAFLHILLLGGYLPGSTWIRLGPIHLAKDLFFGVPGLFKTRCLTSEMHQEIQNDS